MDDNGDFIVVRKVNHARIPPPFQPIDIVRAGTGEEAKTVVEANPSPLLKQPVWLAMAMQDTIANQSHHINAFLHLRSEDERTKTPDAHLCRREYAATTRASACTIEY